MNKEECCQAVEILDTKYKIPDLANVVKKQTQLPKEGEPDLEKILRNCAAFFQARPGQWKGRPIDIELKEGSISQNSLPYRVPQDHLKALRKEIGRLEKLKFFSPIRLPNGHPQRFVFRRKTKPFE